MFKLILTLLLAVELCNADVGFSLDSYIFLNKFQPADSIINPGNLVLKTPDEQLDLDIRGEFKWRSGLDRLVIRPRLSGYSKSHTETGTNKISETKLEADLTDAFFEKYWTSNFSSTLGLQVYQWGPAELLNASNPLFHFNSQQRAVFYKEKGKVLLRGNYSFNRDNSLVLLVEPVSNAEPEWIAETKFNPKGVLKYEKMFAGTANQIGFVAGVEERETLFLGQYFNMTFAESFSIYGDVKESKNSLNFVPEVNGVFYDLVSPEFYPTEWATLGVAGVRWEGDFDARLEYVYNGAGFDGTQLNQAILSVSDISNPNYIRNLERFRRIGLEFLGKNYLYFSLRKAEPFSVRDFNVYFRALFSMQDNSSQSQFEADYALFESWQLMGQFVVVNGNLDSEFRLINDWSALVGLKWGM